VELGEPGGGALVAHRVATTSFENRDEAEQVAARLNGTVIHGGAGVYNDGWTVVEA
jgi:hypothetical protein